MNPDEQVNHSPETEELHCSPLGRVELVKWTMSGETRLGFPIKWPGRVCRNIFRTTQKLHFLVC